MGSTGSGTFSDYSSRSPKNNEDGSSRSTEVDKCGQAFSSTLEEISRCYYFMNAGTVPAVGTKVVVTFNGLRIVVETVLGEEIGYLPTKLNYIKVCLDNGFQYSGSVSRATNTPTPSITVDIVPA